MKANDKKGSEGKKVIHIRHWPEGDRPGERLLEKGPEALSDAALLAILIGTGGQGKDALSLAREMLKEFGGFSGLMSAGRDDLMKMKGIGKARIARVLASMEIVKRRLRQPLAQMNVIENPDPLHDYLKASMRSLSREEFRLLYLNRSRHLISEKVLFKGTLDLSTVHPREIMESALRKKASALILAHNHPADLPMVSDEHIQLTKALVRAMWNVEIPVLDHVVIGRNSVLSMKRHYPEIFEGEDDIA
ncbi:MAG: DNA repair protein RadC [Candidatus Desulfacyla sp.]